jgi:hypothetical protein
LFSGWTGWGQFRSSPCLCRKVRSAKSFASSPLLPDAYEHDLLISGCFTFILMTAYQTMGIIGSAVS